MPLDRQSIEKKDFPIGRRGYDPDAVDTHLAALADEMEELKRSSRRRTETLASTASEQVRTIVEAAETSAAEIQRQAEEEAGEIRDEASTEARNTREQATSQARDYVGRVSESTSGMMQRVDAMEAELGALIESLRTGSNRINADLQLLEGNLNEVRDSVSPRQPFEPEPATGENYDKAAALHEIEEQPRSDYSAAAELADEEETGFEAAVAEPGPSPVGGEGDETEGARLIALNMALNGSPREETDRYLAENYSLSDRTSLLDEVYASVEG